VYDIVRQDRNEERSELYGNRRVEESIED